MRYAIFSDVHANRQAWEAVLADARGQGADTLVCLGDVVGYGPKPLEVLNAVREATPNIVLGNHDAAACGRLDPSIFNERARAVIEWTRDRLDEEAIEFLRQVPLQMDGAGIQFVHAEVIEPGEFGYVDGIAAAELNLRAMTQPLGFLGHTHLPMAYTMPRKGGQVKQLPPMDFEVERGKRYLINVGSVGEPRTTDVRASYVIYDDAGKKICFRKVVFDVEAYQADLESTGLEIDPYFVQVVEAGKVAGAPEPAAAPQLALAQLPKVVEVVAGHHARLVLGTAATGLRTVPPSAGVAQPRSTSGVLLAVVMALVLVVAGGIAVVALNSGKEDAAGTPANDRAGKESGSEYRIGRAASAVVRSPLEPGAVIQDLVVRVHPRNFRDLAALREADQNGEAAREEVVENGLVSLASAGGKEAYGLVWEGNLLVPKTGQYEFLLEAVSGAAFLIATDIGMELDGGEEPERLKQTKVILKKGPVPFRLEYVHHRGKPGLALTWSGSGLEGALSLVGEGPVKSSPRSAQTPGQGNAERAPEEDRESAPEPEPVERVAAEKLWQDLQAYWSFDSREAKESRFEKRNGRVLEHLVMEKSQPVRFLVPTRDPKRWYSPKYDDASWEEGSNGLGYEGEPGEFRDLIATRIPIEAGRLPHSVFLRIPFEVEDPGAYDLLVLSVRYDDGFVAYLNGLQVAISEKTAPPLRNLRWNSGATGERASEEAVGKEYAPPIDLKHLREGTNLLAIQGLNHGGEPNKSNTGASGSEMLILPSLVARRKDSTLPPAPPPPKFSDHDLVVEESQLVGEVERVGGKFGEAFRFAEKGSIEIGDADQFAIGEQSFTLSLWFTRDPGEGQARRLVSAGGGSESKAGWALWVQENGAGLTFRVTDGTTESLAKSKRENLEDGDWHHVAVTVDRENQKVLLYLDGETVDDRTAKFLGNGAITSNSGLSIGRSSDGERHHRGMLDDVAIWRRVLVDEEIEKIFKSGKGLGEIFEEEK